MTSIQVNKLKWRIECASDQESPVGYAVSELRKYLGKITESEIAVGTADTSGVIVLGLRNDLYMQDQAALVAPSEGYDGYAISITADAASARVVIGGDNERGCIYGVYDLLERMGCRWFYPQFDEKDIEVVPSGAQASLETGQWAVASPMKWRLFCWASFTKRTPEELVRQYDWAIKCRYNCVDYALPVEAKRRGLLCNGGGHSFGEFLKTEDYFEQHPEWFGMQNGERQPHQFRGSQFCWSNAEARKVFVDNVVKYLLEHLDVDMYGLYGGDGLPACTCPQCATLNASDWEIILLNEAMERLEKSAPNLTIHTGGGYPPVVDPLIQARPHPKMMVSWAHWGRFHGTTYADPDYDWKPNLDSWFNIFKGTVIPFQYYSDHFAEPWVAAPYAFTMIGDRKYMLENQAGGLTNLLYPTGYWWNWGLNNYLCGLSFYDVSINPFDLIQDWAMRYFGESAGKLMARYYREWADNLVLAYHVRGGADDADRAALLRQREEYIAPALAGAKDDPVLLHRLGKVEKLHALAERLMNIQRLHQKIQTLREEANFEKAAECVAEARQCVEETASYTQALIDLQQGLIDPELLGFFYPGIRNGIEEEAGHVEKKNTEVFRWGKKEIIAEDMVPDH